jgi:programmed cell death protein 5
MADELEDIKAKKLQDALQKQQMQVVKKVATLRYMTKEARERLSRVKLVKPELAEQVEMALIQAIQLGQIKESISDSQLKTILEQITQTKRKHV